MYNLDKDTLLNIIDTLNNAMDIIKPFIDFDSYALTEEESIYHDLESLINKLLYIL